MGYTLGLKGLVVLVGAMRSSNVCVNYLIEYSAMCGCVL